jgi:putative membrane protein insertion efficiency factor
MTTAPVPTEPRPHNPLTWLLIGLVRGYQLVVSPWIAPRCKYYPSCSAYALTALRVHGVVRGAGLAGWRLLRCNPWSLGGVDHVPPRRTRSLGDAGSPHGEAAPAPAGDRSTLDSARTSTAQPAPAVSSTS